MLLSSVALILFGTLLEQLFQNCAFQVLEAVLVVFIFKGEPAKIGRIRVCHLAVLILDTALLLPTGCIASAFPYLLLILHQIRSNLGLNNKNQLVTETLGETREVLTDLACY